MLFWNKPSPRDDMRAVDPLGFDALREVMADGLVPLLTGATRRADEYLWTLIGLRAAPELADATVDDEVFSKGFAPFERALKQYWLKFEGRRSGGVNIVERLIEEKRPILDRRILVNERATGLVGNYIVSLRGLGLVERTSIRVCEGATDALLSGVHSGFGATRWASSWANLKETFGTPDLTQAKRRLGRLLFSPARDLMHNAGRAVRQTPAAHQWHEVQWEFPRGEQARVARATRPVSALGQAMLDAFSHLLRGDTRLPTTVRSHLRRLARGALNADPFPEEWRADSPLRRAMTQAWSRLAAGRSPEEAIVTLHTTVTRDIRRTDPWIEAVGERAGAFADWSPGSGEPDYRFANLKTLLRETRWRPDVR